MKRLSTSLILACALLSPASAFAGDDYDITEDKGADYEVQFFDDVLAGSGYAPNGDNITVRPGGVRQTLLRPRTSFVRALIRSVEQL